jgi:hypothetical protein
MMMTNRKNEMEKWLDSPDKWRSEFVDYVRNPETTMEERRESVGAIERRIKQLVGSMEYSSHQPLLHEDEWKRVELWVALRKQAFGTLLLPTTAEVERVMQLNSQLLRLSQELNDRVRDMHKFITTEEKPLSDDRRDCFLEGTLNYEYVKPEDGGFFDMGNDDWYGSDFNYMLSLEYQMTKRPHRSGMNAYCVFYGLDEDPKDFDMPLDDCRPWNDGVLLLPAFENICACYALHALCCHFYYTLPDVMRMNIFHSYLMLRSDRIFPFDYEKKRS